MTTLVVLLVRVTALLVLALLASGLLRHRAAVLTHALWTATFVVLLGLPFAPAVLPSLAVPVLPSPDDLPHDVTVAARVSVPTAQARIEVFEAPRLAESNPDAHVAAPAAPPVRSASAPGWSATLVVLTVWAIAAAISGVAVFVAFVRARKLTMSATAVEDTAWSTTLDRVRHRLGINHAVPMLTSRHVAVPMTTGLWRAAILLPDGAMAWDPQRREIVLAHELSHVAARDPLRLLIGRLACAVYWFHPLMWLATRQARTACERACDEAVIGLGVSRSVYASELMAFGRLAESLADSTTVPMAERSGLEARLTHVLTTEARRPSRYTPRLVGTAAVLVAMTVTAMEPTSAARDIASARATDVQLASPAPVRHGPSPIGPPPPSSAATPADQDPTSTVQAAPPTSLMGRVIDGVTGEGLPGVSLRMRCVGTTFYGRDLVTNDRGEFAIDGLGEDQCMAMVAYREGYTRDMSEMRYLEASDAIHVVHFWPLGNIAGRAVDASGTPVAGVPVDILVQLDGSAPGFVTAGPTDTTDQDGRFHFPGKQTQRRYRLVARTLGASVDVDLPPGQSRSNLELRGGARAVFRVAGRVVQDGVSSSPLNVRLLSEDGGMAIGPVATDPSGAFAFASVPAGTYDVHAQPSGSLSPQFAVPAFSARVVVDDHVDDVVVVAVRVTTLRVELDYDGAPSRGRVLLGLDRLDAPAGTQSSRMLQVGGTAFTVDGLVAGRYAFRATGVPTGYGVTQVTANGRDVTAEGFNPATVDGVVTVTLSNRLATLEGRILTAAGVEASAAAVVVFAAEPTPRIVRVVQATQRGRFTVVNLPPGEYVVAAAPSTSLPMRPLTLVTVTDPAFAARILPRAVRVTLAANETTTVGLREASTEAR